MKYWLLIVAAAFAIIPIVITLLDLYDSWDRMDAVAHAFSGMSLAALSVHLLPLPDIGHVILVFSIGVMWEVIEPRLAHWFGPIHTGHQDTEADIAVVGLSAAIFVMIVL